MATTKRKKKKNKKSEKGETHPQKDGDEDEGALLSMEGFVMVFVVLILLSGVLTLIRA